MTTGYLTHPLALVSPSRLHTPLASRSGLRCASFSESRNGKLDVRFLLLGTMQVGDASLFFCTTLLKAEQDTSLLSQTTLVSCSLMLGHTSIAVQSVTGSATRAS